jgi:hypothetical protein
LFGARCDREERSRPPSPPDPYCYSSVFNNVSRRLSSPHPAAAFDPPKRERERRRRCLCFAVLADRSDDRGEIVSSYFTICVRVQVLFNLFPRVEVEPRGDKRLFLFLAPQKIGSEAEGAARPARSSCRVITLNPSVHFVPNVSPAGSYAIRSVRVRKKPCGGHYIKTRFTFALSVTHDAIMPGPGPS